MKTLVAPIHLDALLLPTDMVARDALADYSRLPYTDGHRDYNPDTPYVGEAILNHAFQDKNLLLRAGVHLHWSLPKGLSRTITAHIINRSHLEGLRPYIPAELIADPVNWRAMQEFVWSILLAQSGWIVPISPDRATVMGRDKADWSVMDRGLNALQSDLGWSTTMVARFVTGLNQVADWQAGADYPAVPDIWLVRRLRQGVADRVWVVESAYVSTTQSEEQGNLSAVNVPFHDDQPDNKTQPFRYLGRQIVADAGWSSGRAVGESYLHEITAVGYNPQPGAKGYAEPTFAAFYPNSMSVFGLYDAEIVAAEEGLAYEVLGLYASLTSDYLRLYIEDFALRHPRSDSYNDTSYFEDLNKALARDFLWQPAPSLNSDETTPGASVLYGKAIPRPSGMPNVGHVQIAAGNTGTEALSAYLAAQVQPDDSARMEDLLEAIQFASRLQNRVLDIGEKFQEARHDKGFTASAGGILWSIKQETVGAQKAAQKNQTEGDGPALPDSVATLLNEVNARQAAYDQGEREVWSLRRQLYADWYRTMLSAYPPPEAPRDDFDFDAALAHMRSDSLAPLQVRLDALGRVNIRKDDAGRFVEARASGGGATLAGELATALGKLAAAVNDANDAAGPDGRSWRDKGQVLTIRPTAGPRFYRANDPVVLFAEAVSAGRAQALQNDRHPTPGVADPVICLLTDIPLPGIDDWPWQLGMEVFETLARVIDVPETGQATDDVIWNPFMLEWEAEYTPAFPGSNEATDERRYAPDYVSSHYQLNETDPDLSLVGDPGDLFRAANLYTGSTLLTPNAAVSLDAAIRRFIDANGDRQTPDTLDRLNRALDVLAQHNVLSQSLGGFHEALLMRKQSRQLDVADPLGFPEYQQFTTGSVAPLVGKANLTAPQPLDNFNPIRSGLLRLLTLRLIDSFGQTVDFEQPAILTSKMLSSPRAPGNIHLAPRLAQAARLNFRFLSAAGGEQEANAHPASSPVCGWLVPNNLDRSLMFYDADGRALGALTMNAASPWQPAPDSVAATPIDGIANPFLRRVARKIFDYQKADIVAHGKTDDGFLDHFLDALDSALENVAPENFAAHQDLALLMSRPIAVARATLNLELDGLPATDQSWTQFAHELQGHGRSSAGFTGVTLPIRLGEYRQVNDGLVGYWLETADGQLRDTYFSSEASDNPDDDIQTYHDGQPLNIPHTLDDPPLTVTMLLDPTGTVHVTSGILPVKAIALPTEQYRDALRRIAVTFLTAPVLSPAGHLQIALPSEPGYEWSWFEKTAGQQWQEIRQTVLISRTLFEQKFPDQPDLWDQLVKQQWLQPLAADAQQAVVTAAVRRAFPPDGGPAAFPPAIGQRIDAFFDAYGRRIEPFDLTIAFDAPQVIREGWLSLGTAPQADPATG